MTTSYMQRNQFQLTPSVTSGQVSGQGYQGSSNTGQLYQAPYGASANESNAAFLIQQRRAASVSPTKYFDQLYGNQGRNLGVAKSDGNVGMVGRAANNLSPTREMKIPYQQGYSALNQAPKPNAMSSTCVDTSLERRQRQSAPERPPSVPLGRNTPTPVELKWPQGDRMPGRVTPTKNPQRSPSAGRRTPSFPKTQLNERFSTSRSPHPQPSTISTSRALSPSQVTPGYQVERGQVGAGQFARTPPRNMMMMMQQTGVSSNQTAGSRSQSRDSLTPGSNSHSPDRSSKPAVLPETQRFFPNSDQQSRYGTRQSPNHLARVDARKQKRREAGVPKFYDSSTDDGVSQSGSSRRNRKGGTPSEHQVSPVVNQLPLLPEQGMHHEKLIVQSVEKMQSANRTDPSSYRPDFANQYARNFQGISESDGVAVDDSEVEFPAQDRRSHTPVKSAVSPVYADSQDEITERQPFLGKASPPPKLTNPSVVMSSPKLKPRKGSFLKNLTSRNFMTSRQGSDSRKQQQQPPLPKPQGTQNPNSVTSGSKGDVHQRLDRLELMCENLSTFLGVPIDSEGLNSSANKSPRPSGVFQRTPSMTTRWSKRRAKDNTAINKRFERLEEHVMKLSERLADTNAELKTTQAMLEQVDFAQREISLLQDSVIRKNPHEKFSSSVKKHYSSILTRNRKLTWFFGESPPLLENLMKDINYENLIPVLSSNSISVVEYPLLSEDKLQKLGIAPGAQAVINQAYLQRFCAPSECEALETKWEPTSFGGSGRIFFDAMPIE